MGVRLFLTAAVALRQLGHPLAFNINKPLFTDPIAVSFPDLAECFFLLAMLAILIHRFARSCGERDRIASELDAARALQHVLIPDCLPSFPGLSISAAYFPAQEVGGDFYQIFPLASAETLIILGDVSGKGLRAAMTVSMIVGAVRALIETLDSPASILAGLNRQLCERDWGFTTCVALRISADGLLVVANAGHLLPYRNGVELDLDPALPLGIAPGATYPEFTVQLLRGDRLTLLTDGIPEATCLRELFGFARTQELSAQSAITIADAARNFGQSDDITVLSVDFQFGYEPCGQECIKDPTGEVEGNASPQSEICSLH
jgi:serine phosphatase RsbU (regulator of sigma subunit)